MTWLYRILSWLVIAPAIPFFCFHPKLKDGLGRRLGRYEIAPWPKSRGAGPRFWLHGASAGDVLALRPIIAELRERSPEATIVVSCLTGSGFAMATDRLGELVDAVTYVPYDLPFATRRAIEAIRPDLLVLEYAELWPNLIAAACDHGAKIVLTNGRLSESLVRRYRWFHRIFGNPLTRLDAMLMREDVEVDRALLLGAPKTKVRATGNTKFDNLAAGPPDGQKERLAQALALEGAPMFTAGSTHEGEERLLVPVFHKLREVQPGLVFLVAPRYPERASKLVSLFTSAGFVVELRSALGEVPRKKATNLVVVDTIGELMSAYALSRLVFVGGSFVSRGGQNILEPAGQGRPVLFGPYMANFRDSVEVLVGRGGIQVGTPDLLERVARELLERPEEIERLGEMAKTAVSRARGASKRNVDVILGLLGT